jgi:tRNA pseudouridine13 synthase
VLVKFPPDKLDCHAITTQWFSVQLPKIRDIDDISEKLPDELKIIEHHWHQSKLKTGQLKGNVFKILIQDITGDTESIVHNISEIRKTGVPNYFGPQRFGHQMANIQQAQDWFSGKSKVNNRNLRGLLISAARSHIFNLIVAHRIEKQTWNTLIAGDILQLNGSHSWFHDKDGTAEELSDRLEQFDIHITAAMWGEDSVQSTGSCAALEQSVADQFPIYHQGFANFRVKQDRRAMRVIPKDLNYCWIDNNLQIEFNLPPGAFATGVLREILNFQEATTKNI